MLYVLTDNHTPQLPAQEHRAATCVREGDELAPIQYVLVRVPQQASALPASFFPCIQHITDGGMYTDLYREV